MSDLHLSVELPIQENEQGRFCNVPPPCYELCAVPGTTIQQLKQQIHDQVMVKYVEGGVGFDTGLSVPPYKIDFRIVLYVLQNENTSPGWMLVLPLKDEDQLKNRKYQLFSNAHLCVRGIVEFTKCLAY